MKDAYWTQPTTLCNKEKALVLTFSVLVTCLLVLSSIIESSLQCMGAPLHHQSNEWVDPKVPHACPLTWGNKYLFLSLFQLQLGTSSLLLLIVFSHFNFTSFVEIQHTSFSNLSFIPNVTICPNDIKL